MRVLRLNFVYQPTVPIQSLVDPHSPDSKICSAPPVDERQVRDELTAAKTINDKLNWCPKVMRMI